MAGKGEEIREGKHPRYKFLVSPLLQTLKNVYCNRLLSSHGERNKSPICTAAQKHANLGISICVAMLDNIAHTHGALSTITEATRATGRVADRLTVKLPFIVYHSSTTVKLGSSDNGVINKN